MANNSFGLLQAYSNILEHVTRQIAGLDYYINHVLNNSLNEVHQTLVLLDHMATSINPPPAITVGECYNDRGYWTIEGYRMNQVNRGHRRGRGHGRRHTAGRGHTHGEGNRFGRRVWKRGRWHTYRGRGFNRYAWRAPSYRRPSRVFENNLTINIRNNSNVRLLVAPSSQTEITMQTVDAVQEDSWPTQSQSAPIMSQMNSLAIQWPPEPYQAVPIGHAYEPLEYPSVVRESPTSLVRASTFQQLRPGLILEAPAVLHMQPSVLLEPARRPIRSRQLLPSLMHALSLRTYSRNTTAVPGQPNGLVMHSYPHLAHPEYDPTGYPLHSLPSVPYL